MKPMKKTFTILLAAALALSLPVCALPARAGFGHFTYSGEYTAGQFHDVRDSDWFAQYVEDAYNYGFFRGKSAGMFDPGGLLTFGEAVTLASRLRSIYHTGSADFPASDPFYAAYADYALMHGIIGRHGNYIAPATRAQFAVMVYNALPADAYAAINEIPDYGISDVMSDSAFGPAVYALYRAGVLSGSDRFGTFFPASNITRAEACAVMVRIAWPAARIKMTLPTEIPAEVIFQRSADAVFMLETYDSRGNSIRTGSGFFISDTGLAVTNQHVFDDAARATITLNNGDAYPVRGVLATSDEFNITVFSIDSNAGGWSYLNLADSDLIEVGATVYALGSPQSLLNTMSEGIISHSRRELRWDTLIQFTAPISFGSGGSPLLNTLGQVIGIASSSFAHGQNLNLAVPINRAKELVPGPLVTLEDMLMG